MTMGVVVTESVERSRIVDLDRASDVGRFGGKASPLARAIAAGHRVPAGFVVPTDAQGDRGIAQLVSERVAALGKGPFAVRSSAVGEDGRLHSFAGQLQTRLHVEPADVFAAVEACWASSDSLRVLRYGSEVGGVAVIVQRMVAADAAGVAFSADPQTGERDVVVIEAVPSLGVGLVEGAESPETWRVHADACERVRRRDEAVLSQAQADQVAELARAMEALFGAPQDVEWALADGEVVLLQSRPITALPAAPVPIEVEVPEGSWERDDHHGVLSPLGWAWFQAYPKAMAEAFKSCGAPIDRMDSARIGGHLYGRMVMEGPDSDKLPPRWVLWLATRLIPAFRRANRTAEAFLDDERYMDALHAWEGGGRDAMRDAIDALFVADPRALSDEALLERIDRALALCHEGLHKHAFLHGPGVFAVGKLVLFLEDELGWDAGRVYELIAGSSPSTTALHDELEAIVEAHASDLRRGEPLPHALARELANWLDDNHLRMLHYDPKHPTLGERPAYLRSIVDNILHELEAPADARNDTRATAVLDEAVALLSEEKATELRRLVEAARAGYALREENATQAVSRPAGLLRHFVLELGRRIEPRIGAREHAVYLYPEEHGPALRGELDDVAALIERRRGEESWALQHRGPKRFGPPPPPNPPADVFPRGMSRLMRIIGWMESAEAVPEPSEDDVLRGVGIGNHKVKGRARIVRHPEDMVKVRPGEIVVCRITSPEWAVGLGRVAALVSDEGGMLSHPAIVAREFDVPAVVGCTDATKRIHTGDTIEVDPVAATVTIIH